METIVYRYAVDYLDSWGDPATDMFGDLPAAERRLDYLAERGRDATMRPL